MIRQLVHLALQILIWAQPSVNGNVASVLLPVHQKYDAYK